MKQYWLCFLLATGCVAIADDANPKDGDVEEVEIEEQDPDDEAVGLLLESLEKQGAFQDYKPQKMSTFKGYLARIGTKVLSCYIAMRGWVTKKLFCKRRA